MKNLSWIIYLTMGIGFVFQCLLSIDRKRFSTIPENIQHLPFARRILPTLTYLTEDGTFGYRHLPYISERTLLAAYCLFIYAIFTVDWYAEERIFNGTGMGLFGIAFILLLGVGGLVVLRQAFTDTVPQYRERLFSYALYISIEAVVGYALLFKYSLFSDASFQWTRLSTIFLTGSSLYLFCLHVRSLYLLYQIPDIHSSEYIVRNEQWKKVVEAFSERFSDKQSNVRKNLATIALSATILCLNAAFQIVSPGFLLALGMSVLPQVKKQGAEASASSKAL